MLLKMSESAVTDDLELLRQFTRDHSQAAFTALVHRHVNLVYSAALRQVRSPQLAEDVTQSTFADLARNAAKLTNAPEPAPVLAAWLYQVARHTAVDVIRKESRRQLREQIAVEMNAMNATEASWTEIEPLLDEAVAALDETDRAAVLLRYFENESLRAVGQQLGVSDDAAQKRVSRAVERLREFFAKRGVSVGAGGLVVVISANAVQAAPVGLAVTISAAALAGTAVTTSTLIAATTKSIAMTTLQKTLVTATVAVLAGAGVYEARQAAQLRDQVQTLQQQQAPLAEQMRQMQDERDHAANRLADLLAENSWLKSNPNHNELLKLRGEVTRLRNTITQELEVAASDKTMKSEIALWLSKRDELKRYLQDSPQENIPELQFMTDRAWMFCCEQLIDSDSTGSITNAARFAQGLAKSEFGKVLEKALRAYLSSSGGVFPTDFSQLEPHIGTLKDKSVFQRYTITPAQLVTEIDQANHTARATYRLIDASTAVSASNSVQWIITQTQPMFLGDPRMVITSNGVSLHSFSP